MNFMSVDDYDPELDRYRNMIELRENCLRLLKTCPRKFSTTFSLWGFIAFEDIAIFDPEGDPLHEMPHLYVHRRPGKDFFPEDHLPHAGCGDSVHVDQPEYLRIRFFPEQFEELTLFLTTKDKPRSHKKLY